MAGSDFPSLWLLTLYISCLVEFKILGQFLNILVVSTIRISVCSSIWQIFIEHLYHVRTMNAILNAFLWYMSLILPSLVCLVLFTFPLAQKLGLSLLCPQGRLAKCSSERGRGRGAINDSYPGVTKHSNFTVRSNIAKRPLIWSFSVIDSQIYLPL